MADDTSLARGPASSGPAAPPPVWQQRPIRLALLVDTLRQPAWVAGALRRAVVDGVAELVGVGVLGVGPPPERGSGAGRSRAEAVYLALDARRYAPVDDPGKPVALRDWLARCSPVPLSAAGVDRAGALVLAPEPAIDGWNADLVWYLGGRTPAEPVPDLARLGVWMLDPPSGAVGARAMIEGRDSTETTLRRLADARAPGTVLARIRTSTERISPTVNRAEHLRHVAESLVGWLARASRFGPAVTAHTASTPAHAPAQAAAARAVDHPLTAVEALRLATRTATRLVHSRLSRTAAARWQLGYHFADQPAPGAGADRGAPATSGPGFTLVSAPPDRYWADPFPVERDGRYYVFFEEHMDGSTNAHLSVAELDPTRGLIEPRVVLRRDHHLSFPSVFCADGAWYMTPEASTTGVVPLYRATRFPDGWEHVGDLVAGEYFVDPVVTRIGEAWWLFTGVRPAGAAEATALHLYHAPALAGPWTPHLLNPVTVDVRTARPAGRVFTRGGRYFRPVQDGAPHYGRAMAIHRVDALTPTTFRETAVERLEPDWRPGLEGTHTLNAAGRLTTLDVLGRGARA